MKTTKVVSTTRKLFKTAQSAYTTNLSEKMKGGIITITNPSFDSADKVVFVEEGADFDKVAKAAVGADTYVIDMGKNADVVARKIRLAEDDSGLYKTDKPAKVLEFVDAKGKEIPLTSVRGKLLARKLGNMAPNDLTPHNYAKIIESEFNNAANVTVKHKHKEALEREGFNTLLSVAQGSANLPVVVTIEYRGNPNSNQFTTALVGKGLTFDSGGISLKPGAKMHEMKFDMCGSAAVIGAMRDLVDSKADVNVVAVVGLVENMPGGKATRPGDVVTTKKGITVENWNTDAEGRLVLCDLLTYVQEEYPTVNKVVDVATLTGAILVALADEYAGLFTNSTKFGKAIKKTSERFWRMPMGPEFAKQLDGVVADLKNIGDGHPGSTTAAEFLYKFINEGVTWAHLDIAGTAWKGGKATGFGVDALQELVTEVGMKTFKVDKDMKYNYEKKEEE